MKNFFKRVKENKKPKFIFTTKYLGQYTANGIRIADNNRDNVLGNIIAIEDLIERSNTSLGNQNWGQNSSSQTMTTGHGNGSGGNSGAGLHPVQVEDKRQAVAPIEVFTELKREDPGISFDRLDEKIEAVEERLAILSEHLDESHLQDEHRSLFFLKNRRKYLKTMKKNPLDWAMTTSEAVKDLCTRYKLQVVALKQYYTLVPNDGLKEMKRYSEAYKAITGDEPIFELVIKDTAALPKEEAKQTKKKDRDPILLANSPLGNFMFVLGAWDDEVEVVDEIIYGGK